MKKLLIVVDMQNDFIDGALGTAEAQAIVKNVDKKIRDYDEASCKWIELMKHLRAAGVQIEALVEYTELAQQGESTEAARKAILLEQREQLEKRIAEMQQSLERLNKRLEWYDRCEGCTIERIKKLEQQRKG